MHMQVKALEGHRVVEGSCGGTHTMVVTDEGRCFIWGRAAFGRLGTGVNKDCISPVELKLPGGPERWRVISVAAGGRHSMALALPDNGNLGQRLAEVGDSVCGGGAGMSLEVWAGLVGRGCDAMQHPGTHPLAHPPPAVEPTQAALLVAQPAAQHPGPRAQLGWPGRR